MKKLIKVIACGVFEREIEALRDGGKEEFVVELLDAGLHSRPKELKVRLQAAIDGTDPERFKQISILYGLCGRGAIGLVSRDVPVVLPRVHDCIALFLGDPEEYRRQFKTYPGTFYMTPGWFEKKAHPDQYRARVLEKDWCACQDPNFEEWSGKYGQDNALFISDFFQSWRKNYKRVALINNGLGEVEKYRKYVRMLSEVSGWRCEELKGAIEFVRTVVFGPYDDSRLLAVPPHHLVIATNDRRIFTAVPAHPSEEDLLNAHRVMAGVHAGKFVVGGQEGEREKRLESGLGLGIDAGGTYTDAVLISLETGQVVSKAKAPTTHQELAIGVQEAIGKLPGNRLEEVNLVSLSTTLATNAIVEDRGAHVGLLIMPLEEGITETINVRPMKVVKGRMTVDGQEVEAVDPEEVRKAVREMLAGGVEAFAVSGYGGVHNPDHEKTVKEIIHALTDVPVVCGHELSSKLNFIRRAYTAVLNARLMPVVDDLLRSVENVLKRFHIHAPVYIVRGDGSLIETSVARERAIETILSGPAASAIGAKILTGKDDLIALDMGGTTTDVAIVSEGSVSVCREGAVVGPWQTSVSAAEILTTGLGGDSYVQVLEGGTKIVIGPQRVIPLSFLAQKNPFVGVELEEMAQSARYDAVSPLAIEFFEMVALRPGIHLSDQEKRVLGVLEKGPISRRKLAAGVGALAMELIPTGRLEQLGIIRRSAFTPTDALHVLGTFREYDPAAALNSARILAGFAKQEIEAFVEQVRQEVVKRLAYEIMRREISLKYGDPAKENHPMLEKILAEMVSCKSDKNCRIQFREYRTVVGIGAPAGAFLPEAGKLLDAEVIVPLHAEVANAVGAIMGKVVVREIISIRPDEVGSFIMMSPLGRKEYGHLCDAQQEATDYLVAYLRKKALEFGTDEKKVEVMVREKSGLLSDGSRQFLELVVEGSLQGLPRAAAMA
jgi:N-methylhydantoinase A/oxoprolinase/acetone carboxylase beta subunit